MKHYKLNPIAAVVLASLALTGCGSESSTEQAANTVENAVVDDVTNGAVDSDSASTVAATASISIGVKFPQPDINAAWIGDSTSIEVHFFDTEIIGSLADIDTVFEQQEECTSEDNFDGEFTINGKRMFCDDLNQDLLKGQYATQVTLTPTESRANLSLVPGKYRVEARFFDSQSQLQETSVSHVTLSGGTHNLKLRGMEATWTADEPLSLALLNTNALDWDPKKDGVQTAAETLGVNGNLVGLHLPSILTYKGGLQPNKDWSGEFLQNAGVFSHSDLKPEDFATAFQPILRVNDAGNVKNIFPDDFRIVEDIYHSEGWLNGQNYFWVESSVGVLRQQYTAEGDNYGIHLGSKVIGVTGWEDNLWEGRFAVLEFGLMDTSAEDAFYSIDYVSDQYNQNTGENITVATISENGGTDSFWRDAYVSLSGLPTSIVNGSTVRGYLIESISEESSVGNQSVQTAMYLNATLEKIAVAEGLKASSADANCTDLELGGERQQSTQYRWDEVEQRWVAGMLNTAYQNDKLAVESQIDSMVFNHENQIAYYENEIVNFPENEEFYRAEIQRYQAELIELVGVRDEFMTMIDLNQDGTATLFEDGVFPTNRWANQSCYFNDNSWNPDRLPEDPAFSVVCDGIDVQPSALGAVWQASGQMCIQPFTLRASQLDIEYEVDGDIVVE
ncbi:hypothetical protein [Enterovibrio baiacu]|uniref:hypothetical protein n=1 Tax=Enterovibrio baiacu TaxID=2491023 RepID=UPI001010C045|nr:hypothetical protein [Enterovibrio baiacu]MBE1275033.1 hypothetical protein [Enterovibrio baiacu]